MANNNQQITTNTKISADSPTYFQLPHIPIQNSPLKTQSVKIMKERKTGYLNSQLQVENHQFQDAYNRTFKKKANLDNIGQKQKSKFDEFTHMLPSQVNDFKKGQTGKVQRSGFYKKHSKILKTDGFQKQNNICYWYADQPQPAKRPILNYRLQKNFYNSEESTIAKLFSLCSNQLQKNQKSTQELSKQQDSNPSSPDRSPKNLNQISQTPRLKFFRPAVEEQKSPAKTQYLIDSYEGIQKFNRTSSPTFFRTYSTKYENLPSPKREPQKLQKYNVQKEINDFENTLKRRDHRLEKDIKGNHFFNSMRNYGDLALMQHD